MCLSLPVRIVRVDGAEAIADASGRSVRISLSLLKLENVDIAEGDWVLTHTGIAVERIEESDARKLLDELQGGDE